MNTRAYSDLEAENAAVEVLSPTTIQLLQSAEIDQQIATAKRYPRAINRFLKHAKELACLNPMTAAACTYGVPRDGKTITGPSARLAEIIASQWGNCRYGARIVAEDDRFVTAQGVFHDLEQNAFVTFEVKRRITNRQGQKYGDDMISVTSNAACSIALRNAVFKGVPKAVWEPIWIESQQVAKGDAKNLQGRRDAMIEAFKGLGVTAVQIFALLEVGGIEDIGLDEIALLGSYWTSISEGESTVEQIFGAPDASKRAARPEPKKPDPQQPPPEKPAAEKPKLEEPAESAGGDVPAEERTGEPSQGDIMTMLAGATTADEFDMIDDMIRGVSNASKKATLGALSKSKRQQVLKPAAGSDMGMD